VPGIDGEQVPAERIVPDVKEYISETIDDPEAIYDPEIWDTPGFTLVLSWLAKNGIKDATSSRIAAVRTPVRPAIYRGFAQPSVERAQTVR
jgi:hypothetical protein